MRSTALALVASAVIAPLYGMPAGATILTHCGPNLCYDYDDSQSSAALYGTLNFAGDNAYFVPTQFRAQSADGVGLHAPFGNEDVADATFVFSRVYTVNPNNVIANILAYEDGDYEVNYADGEVHGDLWLDAFGQADLVNPAVSSTDSVDFVGASGGQQQWSMSANVSPGAVLGALANDIQLTIRNRLTAFTSDTTEGGEYAFIQKKLILEINTLIPVDVVVPVPAAVWLFGSAFGVLALVRRRAA